MLLNLIGSCNTRWSLLLILLSFSPYMEHDTMIHYLFISLGAGKSTLIAGILKHLNGTVPFGGPTLGDVKPSIYTTTRISFSLMLCSTFALQIQEVLLMLQ
jgi:hypothetical protein